jgi:arsenate reductase-like glutaredoxin family protein
MKPDWDKLMDAFKDSKTQLVADVDCTAEGQPLCDTHGIQGYPTIKWGDPSALEDYEGDRDYDSLKTFAEENLKPMCSPANIDLCDPEKKKEIEKFMAMSADDLDKLIEEKEEAQAKLEKDFADFVEGLQKAYQEANEKLDADKAAIKESGLGLMKAVKAAAAKATAAAGTSDEL